MALSSMTGFARAEGGYGDVSWTVEVRSVNGRNLDIKYRFPPGYEATERLGRDLSKARFQRGQMNLTLSVSAPGATAGVTINEDILAVYVAASDRLLADGKAVMPTSDGLLGLRGVIEAASEDRAGLAEDGEALLSAILADAFDRLKAARDSEGRAIEAVLKGHLVTIGAAVERAKAVADQQTEVIRERFMRRLDEVLPDNAKEGLEERILQEAALLAAKADVREELDRLSSHLDQAHALIDAETAPGRKLDFLSQEFMREANTLCSKAAFIDLTQTGLELKAVIDQFREQVQNVE